MKNQAERGGAPNAYPRHASSLAASLPAGVAPRLGAGDLGRSVRI
jgi:hypothetical protein